MFRDLLRKKQQLTEEDCIDLLIRETRGVLSVLGDDGYPYGMPMNHYYCAEDGLIYFHCGKVGHRLDALRGHDKVSFCVYDHGSREEGEWALHVRSVIVFGRITVIDDMEKIIESRTLYVWREGTDPISAIADGGSHTVRCAMPILSEGDIVGCVVSLSNGEKEDKKAPAVDVETKLIQTAAGFLGRQLES